MFKKGKVLLLIFSFLLICNLTDVSANFVCGTVVNLDNSPEVSPSWMHVKIYYPENPVLFTTCQVSPANNKYCCDPQTIKNITWAVGKTIKAEINEQGFTAQPVSLVTSGAGYDIFPELQLEKIIEIIEPNTTVYLNASSIHALVRIAQQYNNIKYTLRQNYSVIQQNVICENCTQADFYINNLSYGQYELALAAYNSNKEYTENVNFTLLKYLNFSRKIECFGCSGKRVPATAKNITIIVTLNASSPVTGKFYDLFPASWIYQGDLQVDETTDSHSSISWQINGKDIQERYVLKPPQNLFNAKYTFQSGFESFLSEESTVVLSKYKLFDFLSLSKKYLKNIRKANVFRTFLVTNTNPVVMYPKGLDVTEVAIFPINDEKNVISFVKSSQNLRLNDSKSSFLIWSSINQTNIEKVFMKFSFDVKNNQNISLYYYDSLADLWSNVFLEKTGSDKKFDYYQAFGNKTGTYSLIGLT
jgi:hypothetical protein